MRARVLLWPALVCAVTLLVELPAHWLVPGRAVSGSLWHGQAEQVGDVGPLSWQWRPWQAQGEIRLGYQGQDWLMRLSGWPWRWRADVEALEAAASVPVAYRLAGHWQGRVNVKGAWRQCVGAEGRLQVNDLALVSPWSLGLGQGWLQMRCAGDWHLQGALALQGQHQLDLDADLLARRAQVRFEVQPDAALTPLLRGAQWLGPEAAKGERQLRW
ncbi:type II secretion system protein N [Pseudomonas wayambapalatensis]|uniref:general secretion pathway protein GspN n=1 Tax=Pseudomonas sp. L7 TaxID=3388343 RepID=UPI001644AA05|nr:type II secretion system protein N [Pseudomonas wayambapalatensis]